MIAIDTDVPLQKQRTTKYPWANLGVGHSFFAAGKTAATMGGNIAQARRQHGYTLVCRTVTENGVRGCRVWRTA